jgi:hypothetical protein
MILVYQLFDIDFMLNGIDMIIKVFYLVHIDMVAADDIDLVIQIDDNGILWLDRLFDAHIGAGKIKNQGVGIDPGVFHQD